MSESIFYSMRHTRPRYTIIPHPGGGWLVGLGQANPEYVGHMTTSDLITWLIQQDAMAHADYQARKAAEATRRAPDIDLDDLLKDLDL